MTRFIQKLTMVALLAAAATPLVAQSSPAVRQTAPPSQRTSARPDTSPDGGWPRAFLSSSGASIVLYQPQIASWPDQKHMLEVQERQRSGIATALHNDVSQRLTVLQIGIERLKTEVPSARAAFKAQLEKLQTEAKGTVVEEALNLVGGSRARPCACT